MPLVKALRALLVLLALLAIVPTQTGGALAIDELGLCLAEDCGAASVDDQGHRQSPAKPAQHASFAAPDDGTASGSGLVDGPPAPFSILPRVTTALAVEAAAAARLERPPKSA